MARICDLTGKRRQVNNKVSHSMKKSKINKEVNLHSKKVYDPELGQTITLKLSASAIRSLDKIGSLTKFLKKHYL